MWEKMLKLEREVTKPVVVLALGMLVSTLVYSNASNDEWEAVYRVFTTAILPWVYLVLVVLGALSRINKLRRITGSLLVLVAYLLGISVWIWSVGFIPMGWGEIVLVICLLFKGVAVLPITALSFGTAGYGLEALRFVAIVVVAYGARRLGLYLVQNAGGCEPGSIGKPWDALRSWWFKTPRPVDKQEQA